MTFTELILKMIKHKTAVNKMVINTPRQIGIKNGKPLILKHDEILRFYVHTAKPKKIRYFHSFENQHFKFINVGFFLLYKTRHQ